MDRIVLAYSGGLDTTAAAAWLAEVCRAEVVALTVDLGQGVELESLRERALAAGCVRAHVLDAREAFADRAVLPALQAGAMCEGRAPLAAALARPMIAARLVEIARIEGASAVAHGGAGRGASPSRLDVAVAALAPSLQIMAPVRTWRMSRAEVLDYVRARGLAAPAAAPGGLHIDANLWGRSAVVPDGAAVPAAFFTRTSDAARTRSGEALVDISFEQGVPVALSGVSMAFIDIIGSLDAIASSHGVGRIDTRRTVAGATIREVAEAPAAVVLSLARAALESAVSSPVSVQERQAVAAAYAAMIDEGRWYSTARDSMDATVRIWQARCSGSVRVRLAQGTCAVVACDAA